MELFQTFAGWGGWVGVYDTRSQLIEHTRPAATRATALPNGMEARALIPRGKDNTHTHSIATHIPYSVVGRLEIHPVRRARALPGLHASPLRGVAA